MNEKHNKLSRISPPPAGAQDFTDAKLAVKALQELYDEATDFLKDNFARVMNGETVEGHYRAFYPQISIFTRSFAKIDTRLSFGHVAEPGHYRTTITRPYLFENYLEQQIGLLIKNHGVPIRVEVSTTPIPLHFAMGENAHIEVDRGSPQAPAS